MLSSAAQEAIGDGHKFGIQFFMHKNCPKSSKKCDVRTSHALTFRSCKKNGRSSTKSDRMSAKTAVTDKVPKVNRSNFEAILAIDGN